MIEADEGAPAGWDYTLRFYNYLHSHAELEEIDGEQKRVYRGSVTEAFKTLGVSQKFYSEVVTILIRLGCIHYIQRGSRGTVSVVAVDDSPVFSEWIDKRRLWLGKGKDLTRAGRLATIEQRLTDITDHLLGGMNIAEALANHENRLIALEGQSASDEEVKESNGTAQE